MEAGSRGHGLASTELSRDLSELLVFLAGACAGSVSEEVCLAEGVLQGNDSSLSEQHSQKLAGLGCSLGCSPET